MNESEHNSCIAQAVELSVFLLMGAGTFLICFLGIIGNALSTVVLLKSQLKSSVNLLLLGLTFCDTIVILFAIATYAVPNIVGFFSIAKGYNNYLFPLIAPYLLPIALAGQTGSVYFTVAVTVERYVVVCWPLYAKYWCTSRRARFYTIAVFTFSILYNLTRWLELEVIKPTPMSETKNSDEDVNVNCYVLTNTELRNNVYYKSYYMNWLYMVFMYIIPFMVLTILNTSIYKHIKWANVSRRRMTFTRSQARENSIAQMLVSVVVVFLLCNVLAMVNNALESFWDIYVPVLIDLSNFLVTFNSCCNFAIYYYFGQKFRKSFINLWNGYCSCCQLTFKPPKGASSCRSAGTELETLK